MKATRHPVEGAWFRMSSDQGGVVKCAAQSVNYVLTLFN